jgi:hypothetical protein
MTAHVTTTLTKILETHDHETTWSAMSWRLATDISAWAFAKMRDEVGAAAITAMSDEIFDTTLATYIWTQDPETLQDRVQHFLTLHAHHTAFELATTIAARNPSLIELEQLLGLQGDAPPTSGLQHLLREEHFTVLSAAHYQAVREIITKNAFQRLDSTPWPTASLDTGPARGHAQLRPVVIDTQPMLSPEETDRWAQRMWQQRAELSDLDADALDALSALWLYQARTPQDDAVAEVDELLAMRGLRAKLGGQGRRGGYEPEQRTAMLHALSHIQSLWLHMTEMEVYEEPASRIRRTRRRKPIRQTIQSRAFTITDLLGQMQLDGSMDIHKFIFRPGRVFAHFLFGLGRQTALLSARALAYDPYRQTWEKRLARYLSYQWRCRAHSGNYMQTFKVKGLLEAVGEHENFRYPTRVRERLEKAFDTLHHDKVINGWQYDRWEEPPATRRGWVRDWLQATVLVEPPDTIKDTYRSLERHEVPPPKAFPMLKTLGERLKQRRRELGLSQIQAAEQLGMSPSYLHRLEKGYRGKKLSSEMQRHIDSWLTSVPLGKRIVPSDEYP